MKNKRLVIYLICAAAIVLVGVTAFGANKFMNCGGVAKAPTVSQTAMIQDGVQKIITELEPDSYPAITLQKGVPVKWVINADEENLNSCNNEIVIEDLGITKELIIGENVIEFTPDESGVIPYSCWMGMIDSTIAVVDDLSNYNVAEIQEQIDNLPSKGGCCGVKR